MVRTVVGLLLIVFTLQISLADEQSSGKHQNPESWQQFVQFRSQTGFTGTWLSAGKTQALWAGVPAGVPYKQIETCKGSHGGNGFDDTHKMETTEGRVLSRGTAHIFWDESSSQVKGLASGFDDGKPYSGTLTLIGINQSAGVERWAYQEKSRGTTADYIIERVLKDSSHRTTICTSTEKKYVWEVKSHRRNPVAEHFNEFDLIGVWETELPDGSRWQLRNTWTLDGRVVRGANVRIDASGQKIQPNMHVTYWDAARDRLVFQGIARTGASWKGEKVSLVRNGDTSTLVTRYQGVTETGVSMAGTLTFVLQGDRLTRTFSDFSFSDGTEAPSQMYEPVVFKRISK